MGEILFIKILSKTIVSSMKPMEKMAQNINILLQESARLNEVLKVLPGRSDQTKQNCSADSLNSRVLQRMIRTQKSTE